MPKRKGTKQAQNLGIYAKKRKTVILPTQDDGSESESSGIEEIHPGNVDPNPGEAELVLLTEEDASNLYATLQKGLEDYTKRQKVNCRPSRYQKIGSTNRTTVQSQQEKVRKDTAHLRAQGYPDLRAIWPFQTDMDSEDEIEISGPNWDRPGPSTSVSQSLSQTESQNLPSLPPLAAPILSPQRFNTPEVVVLNPTNTRNCRPDPLPAAQNPSITDAQPQPQASSTTPTPIASTQPPSRSSAKVQQALQQLCKIAFSHEPLHPTLRGRLFMMHSFLQYYTSQELQLSWTNASDLSAKGAGKGPHLARQLRTWTTAFLHDPTELPVPQYPDLKSSLIYDEDLAQEIKLHLQSVGKQFKATDIVEYTGREEVMSRLGLEKPISERTAQRWLGKMDYRYGKEKKGMYTDGHEREDVVEYRQGTFLPEMEKYNRRMVIHDRDGNIVSLPSLPNFPIDRRVVFITHDESTFYANDQHKTRWIHKTEGAKPYRKGEGTSVMVSDFCSPELGWLKSKDGTESARVYFRAGKNREGYFDATDLLQQTEHAIDLFETHFPLGNAVALFAFDNATSHVKRAPDALSARHMPKSAKIWKPEGIKMRAGRLPDGSPQDLYFPDDHPTMPGWFKGMKIILEERNLWPTNCKIKAQCKGFKCPEGKADCCARRLLFNQPDFANQKSQLEELIEGRGHHCIFYPKFHCELNFVEMCWGRAKYAYRGYLTPKTDEEMERNIATALDSVTIRMMQRFANRSARFMDAYRQNLTGAQAAWANKKYHGHRCLPPDMLERAKKAAC